MVSTKERRKTAPLPEGVTVPTITCMKAFRRAVPRRCRALLTVLLSYTGKDQADCWPSRATLAGLLGVSVATISEWVSALKAHGAIVCVRQPRKLMKDGTWNPGSNYYWMHPDFVAEYWQRRYTAERKKALHARTLSEKAALRNPHVKTTSLREEHNSAPAREDTRRVAILATPEETACASQLVQLGMVKRIAERLVQTHGVDVCRTQAVWFPHRGTAANPGGLLYRAIVEGYPEPVGLRKAAVSAAEAEMREIVTVQQERYAAEQDAIAARARDCAAAEQALTPEEEALLLAQATKTACAAGPYKLQLLQDIAITAEYRRLVAAHSAANRQLVS